VRCVGNAPKDHDDDDDDNCGDDFAD